MSILNLIWNRIISKKGKKMIPVIKMLTVDEGFKDTAYRDTVGKVTVGIGFNMDDSNAKVIWKYAGIPENFELIHNKTIPITKESAWKLVNVCVDNCRIDLHHLFPEFETYPEGVQLALINLMYNMGLNVFQQFKGFINLVKYLQFEEAAIDLAKTKWATQVGKRKDRVCALLREDDSGYV